MVQPSLCSAQSETDTVIQTLESSFQTADCKKEYRPWEYHIRQVVFYLKNYQF